MTLEQLQFQERRNTGTAWTRNEQFEKDGYLVIKNLWDSKELFRPVPQERGQVNYQGGCRQQMAQYQSRISLLKQCEKHKIDGKYVLNNIYNYELIAEI